MAPGETILERLESVEDTKANSGEHGCLLITNLRIIWFSSRTSKLNISTLQKKTAPNAYQIK